jgi:hypothetical protein
MPPKPTPKEFEKIKAHSPHAGDLAQNSASEELLRRRKAEQLAREYERQKTVFGVKTISILHEQKLPPELTPEKWDEKYGDILDLMTPDELKFAEREKNPQIVKITQDVPSYIQYGNVNNVVFRGDTRGPSLIFNTGFARKDLDREVFLDGETTKGGISTSTDATTVRRKYGNCGDYVYACWLEGAIDTQDFNQLNEVIALHIEPRRVIACAGPIYKPDCETQFKFAYLGVGEIRENMACNVAPDKCQKALKILRSICFIMGVPKTATGAYESS